jgi:pilus assembly protein Flp/PilA
LSVAAKKPFISGWHNRSVKVNPRGARRMSKIRSFLKNESGATAIEYGLIAAGISVAIIAVVNTIGTKLNTSFSSVSDQLK